MAFRLGSRNESFWVLRYTRDNPLHVRWKVSHREGEGLRAHLSCTPLDEERSFIAAELMGTGCAMAMSSPLRL